MPRTTQDVNPLAPPTVLGRQQVDSSAISSLGYDPRSRILEVEFTSGAVYDYFGVTDRLWSSFLDAPSKGQFRASHPRPLPL